MRHWHNAVILVFALPFVSARQNYTRLRAHSLSAAVPNLLVLLGQQGPSCQCTFDDQCTCQGALKFMDCVKTACNSGNCQCIEKDGTNHFLESCSAMGDECPGIGLKCMDKQATCRDKGVTWHSKVKRHAVDKSSDEDAPKANVDTRKYILHTKHKAKLGQMRSHGHRTFAEGVVVTLVVLCTTIALASSSNTLIAKHTWSTIDFVIVTFLALAWFVVVIHSVDYFNLTGIMGMVLHCAVSVVFILVSALVTWMMAKSAVSRGEAPPMSLSIFSGIFAPMVMWCNAGFVTSVQKNFKDSALVVFVFLIVLAIWYLLLALFFHYVVGGYLTKKGHDDDTQNQMAAGALAVGFVLWSHMMIVGRYHAIEDRSRNAPTLGLTMVLNALSIFYFLLSLVTLPALTRWTKSVDADNLLIGSSKYWKLRVCKITTMFMIALARFSFVMSLPHLVLGNMGYSDGSIQAHLLLALTCTAIGMVMIALCAYVPFLKKDNDTAKVLSDLLVGLGGFMVGAAWAGLLDNSISMMVEGDDLGHPFVVKLGITAFLTVFIFPVYCWYLKPQIMKKSAPA